MIIRQENHSAVIEPELIKAAEELVQQLYSNEWVNKEPDKADIRVNLLLGVTLTITA